MTVKEMKQVLNDLPDDFDVIVREVSGWNESSIQEITADLDSKEVLIII